MLPTPSPMKVQTDSFTVPTSTLPKLTSQHWASTLADCQLQCCTLFTVVLQTRSSILAEALTVRLMPSGLGGGRRLHWDHVGADFAQPSPFGSLPGLLTDKGVLQVPNQLFGFEHVPGTHGRDTTWMMCAT